MSTDKLSKFLECLNHQYMMESFYSIWKREATHLITIINVPKEEQNKVYQQAVTLALDIYGEETFPFILSVGTSEVDLSMSSDTDIDELIEDEI